MITILYTKMSIEQKVSEWVYRYWMGKMPADIRDKIGRYRRWQDAQACLFGKALLHLSFQRSYPSCSLEDLKYTSYNRPYVKNGFPDFNISHSGEYVVCVISSNSRVGIDIEEIREMELKDFSRQFSNEEWESIQSSQDRPSSFFNTWSQKEALIKANGKGLSIPLKSIYINDNKAEVEGKRWYMSALTFDEKYAGHLAADIPLDKASVRISSEDLSRNIPSANC